MNQVLIIGGYGGFGLRLARRLAADGWRVLIAGRNSAKADAAACKLDNARGIALDRTTIDAARLSEIAADLIIDAAGPFQISDYRLPMACIEARVPYFDLADSRQFVCGISALQTAARAASVPVVSGASSVPALSAAVARALTADLVRVESIESAISATTRASSGRAVVAAALSYAGQPIRIWQAGRWTAHTGWSLRQCEQFNLPGVKPLHRQVALADVPDLALFPALFPGLKSCLFRGGSEFSLQVWILSALSDLVRSGRLQTALPFARWLAPVQQATAAAGGDRSAMVSTVRGWRGDQPIERRWTLIAEAGKGQEIPTIAAQLLARRLLAGQLASGARDGACELELADFAPLLTELPLAFGQSEDILTLPYRKVLGDDFARLAPELQSLHQPLTESIAAGCGTVTRGRGPLAALLGRIMGFPPAGQYPIEVTFAPKQGREIWIRRFGKHAFSSELGPGPKGTLTERFGPLRFHFAIAVEGDGSLSMHLRGWSVFGVPIPLRWAPTIAAHEFGLNGRFHFDVGVSMPLIGPVVHYQGWLSGEAARQEAASGGLMD